MRLALLLGSEPRLRTACLHLITAARCSLRHLDVLKPAPEHRLGMRASAPLLRARPQVQRTYSHWKMGSDWLTSKRAASRMRPHTHLLVSLSNAHAPSLAHTLLLHTLFHCTHAFTAHTLSPHTRFYCAVFHCTQSFTAHTLSLRTVFHCTHAFTAHTLSLHTRFHCAQSFTAHSLSLHTVFHCTQSFTAHTLSLRTVSHCTHAFTAHTLSLHTRFHCAHAVTAHVPALRTLGCKAHAPAPTIHLAALNRFRTQRAPRAPRGDSGFTAPPSVQSAFQPVRFSARTRRAQLPFSARATASPPPRSHLSTL
eukprot:6214819-Pleurochrysis_carterae.AAC.2